ncbi:hypothetical protein CVT24_001618 [Panaeolus cyanescens]|uniref:Nephrocystin 3-like N-terminal domain-containing protein n=1 Tax=Panaeolus cyanescens TaxID=181874 RepID=A0A409YF41_9AGAR|nr:hypothetical protein CVT24_001618 [Panaeolus cyanescens]
MSSPEASNHHQHTFPIVQWWRLFNGKKLASFPSQKQALNQEVPETSCSTTGVHDVVEHDFENDAVESPSNRHPTPLKVRPEEQNVGRRGGTRNIGNISNNAQAATSRQTQVGDAGQASALFGPGTRLLIHGGSPTFQHVYINQGYDPSNINLLYSHSSPSASYKSKDRYEPPQCHPNTRVKLLKRVKEWARTGPSRLMWLYGPAGVGKSAIAQTTSETLHKDENWPLHFSSPKPHHRKLTESIPGFRKLVQNVIDNKPSVFDLSLSQQVMEFIMEPMKQLQRSKIRPRFTPGPPTVIVVDGLDECQDEDGQKQVLDAIATLVQHPNIFQFSVFLSSRPDLAIRSWFGSLDHEAGPLADIVPLLDHCNSDDDIRLYVLDEMSTICKTHPLKSQLPPSWPSHDDVDTIVKRASGQFIYATTVMKYINDPRQHPYRRLEHIVHNTVPETDHPYTTLDALYLSILRNTLHPKHVHLLLCFCIVSTSYIGAVDTDTFLDFLEALFALPCPVLTLVTDLQSIMVDMDSYPDALYPDRSMGRRKSADTPIPDTFHHASLLEFLLDRRRSLEFHVDVQQFDLQLFNLTLRNLQDFRRQQSLISDEDCCYVVYCFALMLQTCASSLPTSRQHVAVEITNWDSFDSDILYYVLEVLCPEHLHASEDDIAEFNMMLQPTPSTRTLFAKAVQRKIAQCYESLSPAHSDAKPAEFTVALKNLVLQAGLDRSVVNLKRHYPQYLALVILTVLDSFLWSHVPISSNIVSALKDLSSCLFSTTVLEDVKWAFAPYTRTRTKGTIWDSLATPCPLPFWFILPVPDQRSKPATVMLSLLHDYVRMPSFDLDKILTIWPEMQQHAPVTPKALACVLITARFMAWAGGLRWRTVNLKRLAWKFGPFVSRHPLSHDIARWRVDGVNIKDNKLVLLLEKENDLWWAFLKPFFVAHGYVLYVPYDAD